MNNVNFSVEAAGTNAAHRLSAAPTSGMGQSALGNCERRKGEPALSDKNNASEYCSFHTQRNGTPRKTKHPSLQLQPVP